MYLCPRLNTRPRISTRVSFPHWSQAYQTCLVAWRASHGSDWPRIQQVNCRGAIIYDAPELNSSSQTASFAATRSSLFQTVGNRHGRVYLLPVSGRDTVAHKNAQFPNDWSMEAMYSDFLFFFFWSFFLQHFPCIPSRFLRAGGASWSISRPSTHLETNCVNQLPEKLKSQPLTLVPKYPVQVQGASRFNSDRNSTNLTELFYSH